MSFIKRLLNVASGKLSDLANDDESLSDDQLKEALDAMQPEPSAANLAELTMRKQAPVVEEEESKGIRPEVPEDELPPVKKTL